MTAFHVTCSPSKTYVAICIDSDGKHYMKKFVLPEEFKSNDSNDACWFFLNVLDQQAWCIGCITFEDYQNIEEIKT